MADFENPTHKAPDDGTLQIPTSRVEDAKREAALIRDLWQREDFSEIAKGAPIPVFQVYFDQHEPPGLMSFRAVFECDRYALTLNMGFDRFALEPRVTHQIDFRTRLPEFEASHGNYLSYYNSGYSEYASVHQGLHFDMAENFLSANFKETVSRTLAQMLPHLQYTAAAEVTATQLDKTYFGVNAETVELAGNISDWHFGKIYNALLERYNAVSAYEIDPAA